MLKVRYMPQVQSGSMRDISRTWKVSHKFQVQSDLVLYRWKPI